MQKFINAYQFVQKWEGGSKFTQDPDDPGGATKYGISFRFLKDLPIRDADINKDGKLTWQDVQAMDEDQAAAIYKACFWDSLQLESFEDSLAAVLFDSAVNIGKTRTVKMLQYLIGAKTDGISGSKTIAAAASLPSDFVAKGILQARECHYWRLNKSAKWATKYIDGWINRLNDLYLFLNFDRIVG